MERTEKSNFQKGFIRLENSRDHLYGGNGHPFHHYCGFIFTFDWPKWLLAVLAVLVFIDCLFNIFLKPKLRWRRWRYEVRDEEIEIQHGLFVIRKTLIPMVRVQHVDLEQGPILKKYRLATVRVHTAATPHAIPALEGEEADRLRSTIAQLAKVALDDV